VLSLAKPDQAVSAIRPRPAAPQRFSNGEIHDWYRFIWGYSDHLVSGLLKDFSLRAGSCVLDPFCGTGTTLVECRKQGINSVGIDASPASLFVSSVKTRWNLRPTLLLQWLEEVVNRVTTLPGDLESYQDDPTYAYIVSSGMLAREWIDPSPLRLALAIKNSILLIDAPRPYRDAMMLALLDTVVQEASNVRFGPELYVYRSNRTVDLIDEFASRVTAMAFDLELAKDYPTTKVEVDQGDARHLRPALSRLKQRRFDAVICSPPYPAEHDYTRNTRLELAFLEATTDALDVRAIKRRMIRSNTKSVYADDKDWTLVWAHPKIAAVAREVEEAVSARQHGFARLYSTVIVSYFGGMYRHLRSVRPWVVPGGKLAYVVSDQAGYANTPIPTSDILGELAEWAGLQVVEVRHWRTRRSSGTSRLIDEEILILQRPRKSRPKSNAPSLRE
jgi:SAM-dependent methyltransferase